MTDYPALNKSDSGFLLCGEPWMNKTFLVATSFHAPEGLAAVKDETGAYHIGLDGKPAYSDRFLETAGFYEGLAAVRDVRGWFHIYKDGSPVNERRFRWSGNFQEGRCVVLDQRGFLHVNAAGADAYSMRFRYAGDFRYGIAVAYSPAGALHIQIDGEPLSSTTYVHAEPFHKGYAVVADAQGFYHVDKTGRAIHAHRFQAAEPFYNGVALCRRFNGQLIRLRINGTWTLVAENLERLDIHDVRQLLAQGSKVGLFLRHAERDPVTPNTPNWGNDVLLTQHGLSTAKCLGQELTDRFQLSFWSSPVQRCIQTVEAIRQGAGCSNKKIVSHTHFGGPGIYFDNTGAHSEFLLRDFHSFADNYLVTGLAPGMRPVPEASEQLLSFLDEAMSETDCTVFITHDFFAAALLSHLGLKAPDRNDWCAFLEGVCLVKSPEGITTFRRFVGSEEYVPC